MTTKICLLCVFLLESIPGALCYEYNVGGMVAASLAAFVMLVAIVLLIFVAVSWRDWYMKRQAKRGRYRIPRQKWRLFRYNVMKKTKAQEGTPRSDRKMNMRMYNIAHMPDSRPTTLERQEPITDAWVTRLPPVDHYEEKAKTMKFEPEEDHVIVADVLSDNRQRMAQPVVVQDNRQRVAQPVVMQAPPSTHTVTYQDSSQTNYYPYKADDPTTPTIIQSTSAATGPPVSYEPYHVRVQMTHASQQSAQQLSQTTRPAQQYSQTTRSTTQQLSQTLQPRSTSNDIIIQPNVPSTNVSDTYTGVVVFDAEDDAGNMPGPTQQTEDIVLF